MAKDTQQKRKARGGSAGDDKDAGPPPPYEGVGHTLCLTREQAGQALADVAAHLRIRHPYLLAIEEGRFDDLPGRIYAIGFLRSYSEYLGLDEAAVIAAFKAESAGEPGSSRLNFPVPAPETRMPGAAVVAVALLAGIAIYGGWAYVHRHDVPGVVVPLTQPSGDASAPAVATAKETSVPLASTPAPATSAQTPAQTSAQTSAQAAGAGAAPSAPASASSTPPPSPDAAANVPAQPAPGSESSSPAAAGTSPGAPAANPMAQAGAAGNPATGAMPAAMAPSAAMTDSAQAGAQAAGTQSGGAAPAATSSASAADETPGQQVFGQTQGPVRVVLLATANSWINVQAQGKVLLPGRVLKPGDRYRVPDQPGVVLWTGNLGGLQILVDGKAIPKLGTTGEARHDISLDPKRLLAGTALPH